MIFFLQILQKQTETKAINKKMTNTQSKISVPVSKKQIEDIIANIKKSLPKNITVKITNNNGKCGTGSILSLQRTKRSGRCTMSLGVLKNNGFDSIEKIIELRTFLQGLVIMLENNDYFDLIDKQDDFSKYLISIIGSDEIISSIIVIMSTNGDSGSSYALSCYEKIKPVIEQNNWKRVERKPDCEKKGECVTEGNNKWHGQYYYKISGGSNTKIELSHPESSTEFQLFNEYFDYANEDVCLHINVIMIFYMLHCFDIHTYIKLDDVIRMISTFETFLKETHYDGGSLYDTCLINECIVDEGEKRILICPLTLNKISINQFDKENLKTNDYNETMLAEQKQMQICHNEAVSKKRIYYDKTRGCILTAARPQNLFWGEKLGNMQQQDFTINEYWNDLEKKIERRKQKLNRPGQQLP